MDKREIVRIIEDFAPPELAESWDCSGWLIETPKQEIVRVMLCLTVTEDIIEQAETKKCDMIISHHPLFKIPLAWKNFDIYCAHTNLDRTQGGTTDTLIDSAFPRPMGEGRISSHMVCDRNSGESYLRYILLDNPISVQDFDKKLSKISPNLRYVNNFNVRKIKKIAFCAGSGADLIEEASENGADALVTGDLKFHTALESPIVVFDIGHFESEILVLKVFERLLSEKVELVIAKEKSPFKTLNPTQNE